MLDLVEAGDGQELDLGPIFLIHDLVAVGIDEKPSGNDLGPGAADLEHVLGVEVGLLSEVAHRRHGLGIGQTRPDTVKIPPERLDFGHLESDIGQVLGREEDGHGVTVDEVLDHERRTKPGAHLDPAPDLDVAVVGVLERFPRLVELALDDVVAELDPLAVGDTLREDAPHRLFPGRAGLGPFRDALESFRLALKDLGAVEIGAHRLGDPFAGVAVGRVEVLPGDHVAIAGDDPLPLFAEIVIDRDVLRRVLTEPFPARAAEDHASVVVEGPGEGDVRLGHRPLGQGLEPDPGKGVFARTALDVGRRPVEAPVAVGVDVARPVLVDLAIAVVVDALLTEHRPFPLLPRLDADHQPRVLGVGFELAEGVLLAHRADVAVAVEVVGGVFVDEAVLVVVHGNAQAAVAVRGVGVGHEVESAVDIDDGHDVEAGLVHEARHLRVLAVVPEHVVKEVERNVPALNLVAVHVAVDIHPGLVQDGARLGVVDGQSHDGPAFLALADRLERRQLGIGLVERPEGLVDLVQRVILVEPQRDRDLGFLRRQGRREENDQQDETGELSHLTPPRSILRESPQAIRVSALTSSMTGFAARTIQVTSWEPRAGTAGTRLLFFPWTISKP